MFSIRSRFIILSGFLVLLGALGLYVSLVVFVTGKGFHGQDLLMHESNNIFIKYFVPITLLNLSSFCLSSPFLFARGIITLDYYNESRYKKALNNFVVMSFAMPSIFIMVGIFCEYTTKNVALALSTYGLFALGLVIYYFYCLYIVVCERTLK